MDRLCRSFVVILKTISIRWQRKPVKASSEGNDLIQFDTTTGETYIIQQS
jgi:hypothetical protein